MESYSVEAILSATDRGFSDAMKKADSSMDGLSNKSKKTGTSIMDIAKGVGVFKLVDSAVSTVMGSLDGAIDRFDTLNKYPTVMQALGYSADEVDKSMNKLKDGIDGLPTSLDGIVSDTQQLSIALGDLDKGTDTAIALNNAFLASGASTADASRGMEQYRQMLGRGEVDMQSWMSVVDTMPLAMDKVAKSFEDKGVKSTNELYDALKEGDITFTEFNDRLIELNDGVGGFADLAQKNSKGIKTSFANLKTAVVKGLETVIRAIDENLEKAGFGSIADNIDGMKTKINDAFAFIVSAIPPVMTAIGEIVEILKLISPILVPLLAYIVTYQTVMGTAKKAIEIYTAAQKIMNAVMSANPIGIVIAAVILLVGWFIYMWKTNEDFRNAVIKIWENVRDAIVGAWDGAKKAWDNTAKFFKDMWQNIKTSTTETWESIKDFFSETWQSITDGVKSIWDSFTTWFKETVETLKVVFEPFTSFVGEVFERLATFLGSIWENIMIMAGNYWNIIKNVILAPVLFVTSLISGGWEEAKNNMIAIWENIKTSAQEIFEAIKNIIVILFTSVRDGVINIWNATKDFLVTTWDNLKQFASETFEAMVQGIINAWENLKSWTSETWNNIKQFTKDTWENIKQSTIDIANRLVSGAKQAWEDLKQSVIDVVNRVKETFNKLREINLFEIGKNVIQGFVDGISNMISSVGNAVKNVASNVTDGLKNALGIHSPSRVMRDQVGKFIPLGVVAGIEKEQSTLDKALDSMIDTDLGYNVASDLENNLNRINGASLSSANEITLNEVNKPANIMLNIGGRVFSAFVEDISNEQGTQTDLLLGY